MSWNSRLALCCLLVIFQLPGRLLAGELKTLYATVSYDNDEILRRFNQELDLPNRLQVKMRTWRNDTVRDEVSNKINLLVDQVQTVMDMHPDRLKFTIVLLPSPEAVQEIFLQKYGKKVEHLAYYSLSEKTIYFSVDKASLNVVSHEIGHVVVDHYYKVHTPYNIHELMAQFAEKNLTAQ